MIFMIIQPIIDDQYMHQIILVSVQAANVLLQGGMVEEVTTFLIVRSLKLVMSHCH